MFRTPPFFIGLNTEPTVETSVPSVEVVHDSPILHRIHQTTVEVRPKHLPKQIDGRHTDPMPVELIRAALLTIDQDDDVRDIAACRFADIDCFKLAGGVCDEIVHEQHLSAFDIYGQFQLIDPPSAAFLTFDETEQPA